MDTQKNIAIALVLASTLTLGTAAYVSAAEGESSKLFGSFAQRGGHHFLMKSEEVNRSESKISNGVQITITTENAEILEKLQEDDMPKKERPNNNITRTQVNTDNGVIITKTSDDPEVVEKMHEKLDKKALHESITSSKKNLENGVQIEKTSTNPEAVTMLQEHELRESKHEEITAVQENISNGVRITITTENPELVEKIQTSAENKRGRKHGRGRGGKGHMRGMGGEKTQSPAAL